MDIDFVITWVDGNDPAWRAEKARVLNQSVDDNNNCRYRDWDNLQFWFRSVEKNAPWVRTIHFVTWGHLPSFLNTEHPKINIVKHEDFIPSEYLPTFASRPIDLNFWRIKELSEHFVYFNDDMFINKSMQPSDFFSKEGLPRYEMIEAPLSPFNGKAINFSILSCMMAINRNFSRKDILKPQKITKWLNPIYGRRNFLGNLSLLIWPKYQHFFDRHVAAPRLKSTMYDVWEAEYDALHKASSHKTRCATDVSEFLFRYWDLARGNFDPIKVDGRNYNITTENLGDCANDIRNAIHKLICINDNEDTTDFDEAKRRLTEAFESRYPNKSEFEI